MDKITIKIPASPEYISTIRITTASLANTMGFDVEQIEDLRVAVSEACNIILDDSEIAVSYYLDDESIRIEVIKMEGEIGYKSDLSKKMAKEILQTLVDKTEFSDNKIEFVMSLGESLDVQ